MKPPLKVHELLIIHKQEREIRFYLVKARFTEHELFLIEMLCTNSTKRIFGPRFEQGGPHAPYAFGSFMATKYYKNTEKLGTVHSMDQQGVMSPAKQVQQYKDAYADVPEIRTNFFISLDPTDKTRYRKYVGEVNEVMVEYFDYLKNCDKEEYEIWDKLSKFLEKNPPIKAKVESLNVNDFLLPENTDN